MQSLNTTTNSALDADWEVRKMKRFLFNDYLAHDGRGAFLYPVAVALVQNKAA